MTSKFFSNKAVITFILLGIVMGATAEGMYMALLPITLEHHGVSTTHIGILTAIGFSSVLILSLKTSAIMHWLGIRLTCIIAAFGALAALWILPLYIHFFVWMPLMFILSGGSFLYFISNEIWANHLATNKNRSFIFGILSTGFCLGVASGPLILKLTGLNNYIPFMLSGLFFALALLPYIIAGNHIPPLQEKKVIRLRAATSKSPAAMVASMIRSFMFSALFSFLPLYAIRYGYSPSNAALLLTATMIGGICFQIPLGKLMDCTSRRLIMSLCVFFSTICSISLPFVIEDYRFTWLLLVVWGAMLGGLYVGHLSLIGERFNGNDLVSANAAIALWGVIGSIAGVFLTGIAMDIWGRDGLSYIITASGIVYIIFLALRDGYLYYYKNKHC